MYLLEQLLIIQKILNKKEITKSDIPSINNFFFS